MYPYPLFLGMSLYEIMIALGFLAAVVTYRIHADRAGYPPALQNVTMLGGTLGIAIGYYAAVLVQAFYNYLASGVFSLDSSTGSTFLGGLLGGVIVFFLIYFGIGAVLYRGKENLTLTRIGANCDIVITCVVAAHAFGRIGCLFAGCCHGAITDGFPGIYNHQVDALTVPIPLFEALFLFALYAVMTAMLIKGKKHTLSVYFVGYGVWRFVIEYFRADDRGQTFVSFLSPSQLTSLVLIAIGVLLLFLRRTRTARNDEIRPNQADSLGETVEKPVENEEKP